MAEYDNGTRIQLPNEAKIYKKDYVRFYDRIKDDIGPRTRSWLLQTSYKQAR